MPLCKCIDVVGGQLFELTPLFYSLTGYCARRIRPKGCIKPEMCGTDVVTHYLFEPTEERKKRCEIYEDKILLKIEGAVSQEKVLRKLLSYEVRNKKSKCQDCTGLCQIVDEFEDRHPGQRATAGALVEPTTPELDLRNKELLDHLRAAVSPENRQIIDSYLTGHSYIEIAADLNIKEPAARQRVTRIKASLREVLKKLGYGKD
ncbi:MAG TPA: hypothetical protein VGN95_04545 [Pyrinomonadaceae bacterium]|nr:hypothetical protein [Pyrinomonadaceae bacterium]